MIPLSELSYWRRMYSTVTSKCLFFLSQELREKIIKSKWIVVLLLLWLGKNIPILFILIRRVFFAMIAGLICFSVDNDLHAQSSLQSALYWYEHRADNHSGRHAESLNIDLAIFYSTDAISKGENFEEAASLALASFYYKFNYVSLNKFDRTSTINKGKELGEQLLRKNPQSTEALYWMAIVFATWIEHSGVVSAVSFGGVTQLKRLAEKLVKKDASYRAGGPYRLLGGLNLYTPKIPLLLTWPSDDKAIRLFIKASTLYPEHPGNFLGLAKCYLHLGMVNKAKPLLEKIAKTDPRKEFLLEDIQLINEAIEILDNESVSF